MVGVAGGTTIRVADYATFGTQQLSDNAIEALDGRLACLLGQHGQISLGKTLRAPWLAVEVETLRGSTCRRWRSASRRSSRRGDGRG